MITMLVVALSFLARTEPETFVVSEATVSDRASVWSTSASHRVDYHRLRVTARDGGDATVYISSFVRDGPSRRGDICSFSGSIRPWSGTDARAEGRWSSYEAPPVEGTLVRIVDEYVCRPGPDSEPAPQLLRRFVSLDPPQEDSTVTVVGVGPNPDWESGMYMTTTLVLGQSDDGDIDPYYLIYFGENEPAPPVGGRCTFRHRLTNLEIVGGLRMLPGSNGAVFQDFECSPPPPDPLLEALPEGFSR